MYVCGIDPGNMESAYTILDKDFTIIDFGKIDNELLLEMIYDGTFKDCKVAIEMIASYGMGVGKTVFDTCVWIGRFQEALLSSCGDDPIFMFRKEVVAEICGSARAKDSNVRIALIDRFAKHDLKNGKGTKANPDYFFGFKKDCWQSFALTLVLHGQVFPKKTTRKMVKRR